MPTPAHDAALPPVPERVPLLGGVGLREDGRRTAPHGSIDCRRRLEWQEGRREVWGRKPNVEGAVKGRGGWALCSHADAPALSHTVAIPHEG